MKKKPGTRLRAGLALGLALVLSFGAIGAGADEAGAASKKSVKKIKLNHSKYTLTKGKKVTLKATPTPKKAKIKKIVWKTSNKKVASVSSKGVVKGVKKGSATITATVKGTKIKASCKITVENKKAAEKTEAPAGTSAPSPTPEATPGATQAPVVAVTGVKVTESITLSLNETKALTAEVQPDTATDKTVTWKSADDKIAKVDDKGNVTGVAVGKTQVAVTTKDGNKTANCEVTVENNLTVASFAELEPALNAGGYDAYVLKTEESGAFEIGEAEYADAALVIDAPKATITNNAVFKQIQIRSLSGDTWIEKATGNTIDLIADKAHVVVIGDDTEIQVNEGAKNISIENNGTIKKLTIDAKANIGISGENKSAIEVRTSKEGARIDTSIPLNIVADKAFELGIQPGAENSTVSIADQDAEPAVEGVGVITITNLSDNSEYDMVAENKGDVLLDKGVLTGTVVDSFENPIKDAVVYVIPYALSIEENKIDEAIQAAEEQSRCYAVQTDAGGAYITPEIPYGNYVLVAKADGLQNYLQTLILNQEEQFNEPIVMTEYTEEKGGVAGVLKNAQTGSPVAGGITLTLRRGTNNSTGMSIATTKTNLDGSYEFMEQMPGNYTIQVTDKRTDEELGSGEKRYIRMSFNVTILANTTIEANMTISQKVESGQVRFVLTWGTADESGVPADLDSHLTGPDGQDGKFHTYYVDRSYYYNGIKYADLDVDDTDYEGPETTTVYEPLDGVYHFYIHDFTNKDYSDNTMLSSSKAVVKVYRGEQNIATYAVPTGKVGTLWDVCTYNISTNILTPVNKIYYHAGGVSEIGLSRTDIAKRQLTENIAMFEDVDLGDSVNSKIGEYVSAAKDYISQEEPDEDAISQFAEELAGYLNEIRNSTAISNIYGEDLYDYQIIRYGDTTYDEEDNAVVQKISRLVVITGDEDVAPQLEIQLYDSENTEYSIEKSDNPEYADMLVVKNNNSEAVEKYYIEYREYEPSLYPQGIKEEGNLITTWYTDTNDDGVQYLYIEGDNEKLLNPEFEFASNKVTAEYKALDDSNWTGELTIKYKAKTRVYMVSYVYKPAELIFSSVKDENDEYVGYDCSYIYMETDDGYEIERRVYQFTDSKLDMEKLKFGFAFSSTWDEVPEDEYTCELREVSSDTRWNYELTVTRKGVEQIFYLNYQI